MSDNKTRVAAIFGAVIIVAIIAAMIVTMYTVNHSNDTKRIQSCVTAGGDWTDITVQDNYADMGCIVK